MRTMIQVTKDFDNLSVDDFDLANVNAQGRERLYVLCDEIVAIGDPDSAIPILFRTMERLSEADLGSPGPIVHLLERWIGSYEGPLADSVRRKPTPLTVWMVNRILNSNKADKETYLALIRIVPGHPLASQETKAEALRYLTYQASKGS